MRVCLGVIDMPYDYGDTPEKTTFEVAQDLQEEYQIFSHFWAAHRDEIIRDAGTELAYQLINHLKHKASMTGITLLEGTEKAFHVFLEKEEMAGLSVDGVPTLAALQGRNSRLKKERGERRPSFIDGGLFKSSFVAWIDNDAEP